MGKLARRSRGFGGLQMEGSFVVYVSHKIEAPPCLARLLTCALKKREVSNARARWGIFYHDAGKVAGCKKAWAP